MPQSCNAQAAASPPMPPPTMMTGSRDSDVEGCCRELDGTSSSSWDMPTPPTGEVSVRATWTIYPLFWSRPARSSLVTVKVVLPHHTTSTLHPRSRSHIWSSHHRRPYTSQSVLPTHMHHAFVPWFVCATCQPARHSAVTCPSCAACGRADYRSTDCRRASGRLRYLAACGPTTTFPAVRQMLPAPQGQRWSRSPRRRSPLALRAHPLSCPHG